MESVSCTCPHCGFKLAGNDKFCCDRICQKCGHTLMPKFYVDDFVSNSLEE